MKTPQWGDSIGHTHYKYVGWQIRTLKSCYRSGTVTFEDGVSYSGTTFSVNDVGCTFAIKFIEGKARFGSIGEVVNLGREEA